MTDLSRSQVNQLGDRLRTGPFTDADRELLLAYRASFLPAYQEVVQGLRNVIGVNPTGRPEKTPESIIAKLRRSQTELGRMQDIAGCRVIVDDVVDQDSRVNRMEELFPNARVIDRRARPSHGYRAVHVIPKINGKEVEIQVRTVMQDLWAGVSERLADRAGIELKYGGTPSGAESLRTLLDWTSAAIALLEADTDFPRPTGVDLRVYYLAQAVAIIQLAPVRAKLP
jgi:putative GTP pyrophosphokinase